MSTNTPLTEEQTIPRGHLPALVSRAMLLDLGLWGGLVIPPALAQELPPVPSMACPLVDAGQEPKMDGVLDEPAWLRAEVQTQFHRYYGGLDRPLEFRLVSDGEWLYVGVTAYEPGILERDMENVCVFIAPHKVSDQFVMFSVTMNAQGLLKCEPPILDGEGNAWRVAFRQHADRWVAELAIRTAPVFGDTVSKGQVFDFNLSRTRQPITGGEQDIYQQWSNTGQSSGTRYRFGEVTLGSPADRVPLIRTELRRQVEAVRRARAGLSAASLSVLTEVEQEAETLLTAAPGGDGVVRGDAVREYQDRADALARRLRRAVLSERGTIIWACNPMDVPMPSDLPPLDVPDAERLDIRVLAGEWESAAIVVTNLTSATMDGQVILKDFVSADGAAVPGWDVLQVRTAPPFPLNTGTRVRDPLPRLPEGDLFRVAPDENELLWLTFKTRDVPPGRYTSTLTVRSLDDRMVRDITLVLRVYPLALGAAGRPHVNVWNRFGSGKDWSERAANCRDYYITTCFTESFPLLPHMVADADGNIIDDTLDFRAYDRVLDEWMGCQVHTYLLVMGWHFRYLYPARQADGSTAFNFERWSPKFNELFARWTIAFRDHLAEKGLPPERWAFYIMDEPPPGENRQEVINFARQLKQVDPRMRTYITFPIGQGSDEENLEISRHVDIVQTIGHASPEVMAQVRANVKEFWRYSILRRGGSPLGAYRRGVCWEPLREGCTGTGFYQWDTRGEFLWRDSGNDPLFAAVYSHHDGTIIPSLRTEAFREGIEDWKYVLMLDEAIARAEQKGIDQTLVAAAKAYRGHCLSQLTDAESAYRFRDAARAQLLALHTALGDVDAALVKAIEAD